jgi:hypothetical protein
MASAERGIEDDVREAMSHLEGGGFAGVGLRRDGDRLTMIFQWYSDPNTYELSGRIPPPGSAGDDVDDPASWGGSTLIGMQEEIETNFLMRAVKTRRGPVLHAELDGEQRRSTIEGQFYINAVSGNGDWLRTQGLDPMPGALAQHADRLINLWEAVVNTPRGHPSVGHIVVVRGERSDEAVIEWLELSERAPDAVGYQLVYTALHHAARQGVRRILGSRAIRHLQPFGFVSARDEDLAVYDVTTQDLNYPEALMRGDS